MLITSGINNNDRCCDLLSAFKFSPVNYVPSAPLIENGQKIPFEVMGFYGLLSVNSIYNLMENNFPNLFEIF